MSEIVKLVLQIVIIIVAARAVGMVFQRMRQPQVMGEMIAGILLGPSLLAWLAPQWSAALFPNSSLGYLNVLSQFGLVLFMFTVGLSINPRELKKQGHAAVLVSHVSIIAPFVLGTCLALYLYPLLSNDRVTFTSFALFIGAAMSITAFPVLARILTERGMLHTRLGTLAVSCAAVDDITGWCVLAYLIILIRARHAGIPLWFTLVGSAAFVLTMVYGVSRLLGRFSSVYRNQGRLTENLLAVLVLLVLTSALVTEWLGIHPLFGPFLLGAIMPKDPSFVRYVVNKFAFIPVVVLLPLFFALTGLRTSVSFVKGPEMWFCCAAIILLAIAGKLGGVYGCRAGGRYVVERRHRTRSADEHTRPHGARHPQYRPGHQGYFALALLHDGLHGPGDHLHDNAVARMGLSDTVERCRIFSVERPEWRIPLDYHGRLGSFSSRSCDVGRVIVRCRTLTGGGIAQ